MIVNRKYGAHSNFRFFAGESFGKRSWGICESVGDDGFFAEVVSLTCSLPSSCALAHFSIEVVIVEDSGAINKKMELTLKESCPKLEKR